eukprot:TRINITY_DN4529_c0_g2_i2.p1 TRINITY_DN4529_c0_g2~~TRINITY_DN4529_c0_g2_i2.p1  ORF type:complete len:190 (+),score=42.49 TRINITY_DN4529_c0_g2_i2:45-614(+)
MPQKAVKWGDIAARPCLPVKPLKEVVLPHPKRVPAPRGLQCGCYLNQPIVKHHSSGKGVSKRNFVALDTGLLQGCAGKTVRRFMHYTNIAEIRVWGDMVHIKAEPSARLPDWLFSMQQPEVHMATVDQLRMLMVLEPRSVLTTDRPIDMQDVHHKAQRNTLDCRAAIELYGPLPRLHQPGTVWRPTVDS